MPGLIDDFFGVVNEDILEKGVVITVEVKVAKRFSVVNIKNVALK
jgi:hypothetical protein